MYITHDYIEEKECSNCQGVVPYFELKEAGGRLVCEYCLDEMYQPETI